jgi:hypothetical protein
MIHAVTLPEKRVLATRRKKGVTWAEAIILIAALVVVVVIGSLALGRMHQAAQRTTCLRNLEIIGKGLSEYVGQNGGFWPFVAKLPSAEYHTPPWPALPDVLAPFMAGQQSAFHCPSDVRHLEEKSPLLARFPKQTTYFETEGTSYEWVLQEFYGGRAIRADAIRSAGGLGLGPADQPLLWDFRAFHGKEGEPGSINLLTADFKARPVRGRSQ